MLQFQVRVLGVAVDHVCICSTSACTRRGGCVSRPFSNLIGGLVMWSAGILTYKEIVFPRYVSLKDISLSSKPPLPKKMSFRSSSPAANTFLVDSLISACRTDGFYSKTNMYMPSGAEIGTYGMQTCGLLPSFGKRGEVTHQNMGMNVHSYIPQIDHWTDPSRPCRIESSSQMSNYTFSQSIKEESNCCMYSNKRVQKVSSSEVPAYSVIPESCPEDGPEIPVPGYFRLSQNYANGKHQENYCHEPPSQCPTLVQLSRVTPQSASASTKFPESEKKIEDNPRDADTASTTPITVESPVPKSGSVEKTCSTGDSVSSPELLQKERKGGLATRKTFILWHSNIIKPL